MSTQSKEEILKPTTARDILHEMELITYPAGQHIRKNILTESVITAMVRFSDIRNLDIQLKLNQQTTHLTAEVDRLKKALEDVKGKLRIPPTQYLKADVIGSLEIIDNALNQ